MSSSSSTTPSQTTYGGLYTPPRYLSSPPDDRVLLPEWQTLAEELGALRQHVRQVAAVASAVAPDANLRGLDEARAGVERLQLALDGLRARGALRAPAPASLTERICLAAADPPVPAPADELLCYFQDFADVPTVADLHAHVVDAREVRLAFGEYAEAHGADTEEDEEDLPPIRFRDWRPLPSPDAAYFLAGLSEEHFDKLAEADDAAIDWDAARCVARIVGYLESYACAAIPWSTLARPASPGGPEQQQEEEEDEEENKELECEGRERYAVGLRIFSYMLNRAALAGQRALAAEARAEIEEWKAEIPEQGFLDPQAWSTEEEEEEAEAEADEIDRLELRRRGMDVTRRDRQHILLEALMHWDEIADDRKHGTKKEFLKKLKGMFSRRG
ncbi:hypothetical protein Hte_003247 [Hypoxylon texense]